MTTSKYLKSCKYFTFLGKLFGISQFSLLSNGNNIIDVLYFVPFLTLYTYLSVDALMYLSTSPNGVNGIIETSFAMILLQHVGSVILKILYFGFRRNFFKHIFYKINKLNAFLKLREEEYLYEDLKAFGVLCMGIVLSSLVYIYSELTINAHLVFQLMHVMNFVEITLMFKMLSQLNKQCMSINEALQKKIRFLALDKIQPKGKIWSDLLDIKKLREHEKETFFDNAYEMAEAHLAIGQIAREINIVFGVSVLFGILTDFTTITSTTVEFCTNIRKLLELKRVDRQIMFAAFNNAFHDALILVKECYTICYWTRLKKTLKNTITCLHKMWNTLAKHNEIDEKSNYLQLLIVQLFNGMPNFSAYGIITMDWPLIILVISSAATYVVIIMQFRLATDAK